MITLKAFGLAVIVFAAVVAFVALTGWVEHLFPAAYHVGALIMVGFLVASLTMMFREALKNQ